MKWFATILVGAVLAAPVLGTPGDDSKKNRDRQEPDKRKEEWKKLSGDEREAKSKETRKTNGVARSESDKRRDHLKNMTPEERAAKRKEIKGRLEKRIAELRAKQTNAMLSAQETRELERREQILKRFEQEMMALPRIERPKPVFTNSPKEK